MNPVGKKDPGDSEQPREQPMLDFSVEVLRRDAGYAHSSREEAATICSTLAGMGLPGQRCVPVPKLSQHADYNREI